MQRVRAQKTIDYLLQHEHAYQKELAFIENPPEGIEVIQIFAPNKLQSKLLGSTDAQLRHDYNLGKKAGIAFLEAESASEVQFETEAVTVLTKENEAETLGSDNIRVVNNIEENKDQKAKAKRPLLTLPFPARLKQNMNAQKEDKRMTA